MSYLDDLFSVAGKTALVTGAATGIGRMAATALVQGRRDRDDRLAQGRRLREGRRRDQRARRAGQGGRLCRRRQHRGGRRGAGRRGEGADATGSTS